MALTLNGTTQSPSTKLLQRLADAISATSRKVRAHAKANPEFREVPKRMLWEWEVGVSRK